MAELCPLFSGSTGNSYYIGSKSSGILVDIGRSCKQVTTVMQRCGIDPLSVQGILITHEHSDHISGLRVFASKYHIPVFASKGTLGALESMGILNDKYPAYTIEDTLELAGMHVNAFRTPHDCAESFGYRIEAEDGHTVTVATDIGHIAGGGREPARHRSCGHRIEPRYRYAAHGAVPVQLKAAHFIGLRASLKHRVRRPAAGAF